MDQQELFKPLTSDKISMLSREDLEKLLCMEQNLRVHFQKDNDRLRSQNNELEQKSFYIEEQYITIKNKFFGKSSEKSPSSEDRKKHQLNNRKRKEDSTSISTLS